MIRGLIGGLAIVAALAASTASASSLGDFDDVTLSTVTGAYQPCDTTGATAVASATSTSILGIAGLGSDCAGRYADIAVIGRDAGSGGPQVLAVMREVQVSALGTAEFLIPVALDATLVTDVAVAIHDRTDT